MKTLVIFAFVMIYFQNIYGAWEHPHYSFRCRESAGIEIFGIHANSTVTVLEGNASCRNINKRGELYKIPYNCASKIKNNQTNEITGYKVGIRVVDPKFDKSISNSAIPQNITGGHKGHNFNIQCNNIPKTGVNRTVARVFRGGAHQLPVNNKEVSSVVMHFRATRDINVPEISEIYIGDEFYMFLEYTGNNNYKIKPKQCKAYQGTVVPTKKNETPNVTLWNSTAKNQNCAEHKVLLESMESLPVNSNSKEVVVAKLYGFRFSNSNYITITCDVGVFPASVTGDLCETARRKRETLRMRRQVFNTPFQRKNMIGKLKINDHSSEYSSSANNIQASFGWFQLFWGLMIMPFFRNVGYRL